jgi:hypothetical protein
MLFFYICPIKDDYCARIKEKEVRDMTIMWFIMLLLIGGVSLLYSIEALLKKFFNFRYGVLLIMGLLSLVGAISIIVGWISGYQFA